MAVVVVMLLGFIIASTIAATVLFTIQANSTNRSTTQAFIAAESGRDQVVSQIVNACSGMSATSTSPQFTSQAYTTTGSQPSSPTGLTKTCPTKDTTYVLIQSTGTGPDGSTSTINSVYRWSATYTNVPGGVVTYFSGSVSQGVAHYTGDLVLRNGDWSCLQNGILDGDLYVLTGTVSFSNNCTINGDVWSNGYVSSNSLAWKVNANVPNGSTGSITTNGYVDFTADGSPTIAGNISAGGTVTLKAGGGGAGKVGGTVTSKTTASVASAWTTGAVTQNTGTDPTFVPTLDWLLAATRWIDLNNTSGWGTITNGDCSALKNAGTATAYVQPLITSGTTPLVLDFTSCTKATNLNLSTASPITRDVAIITGPNNTMTINVSGLTSSTVHQLMFIHSDGNLDDRDADGAPQPTCGSTGTMNAADGFGTAGTISPNLHIMIYSPCGLNGTVTASFSGQLYTNDTTNFHSGSAYTCQTMSWPSALPSLGCKIKGPGGIGNDTTVTQKLGSLIVQTEQ
ncbi:hypothetical protein [Microbacterium rhizosphaerae]|uniref:Type 4 fimbrial biogenesis protein PilX N-terminal domain-containing protein n=1 Tax=Microbacterium rhizosphaerae TaxID=1678237 RepID=A0ABZ0SQB2_9MICO|nr:hypothetical protein [Microbacterium rhizosphaerae]WPR91149.1 hypothetical protein SM116_07650 [Microbacterium rhizosphaerae]